MSICLRFSLFPNRTKEMRGKHHQCFILNLQLYLDSSHGTGTNSLLICVTLFKSNLQSTATYEQKPDNKFKN